MNKDEVSKLVSFKLFDSEWYKKRYADVKRSGITPLRHYVEIGHKIGRSPSRHFNAKKYLSSYPDVQKSMQSPIQHYLNIGQREGRTIFPDNLLDQLEQANYRSNCNGGNVLYVMSDAFKATPKYRAQHTAPILQSLGWNSTIINEKHLGNALKTPWDVVVLIRLALSKTELSKVREYRASGGIVIYDIDDFIFDPNKASLQNSFGLKDPEHQDRTLAAMQSIRNTLLACDLATTTTLPLAKQIESAGIPAFVIPNSFQPQMPEKLCTRNDHVNICYLSGTATHNKDFAECEDALISVLNQYSHVTLHIVGPLKLPEALEIHSQVKKHELMPHGEMLEFLSAMDINLAPLELGNEFTACKSELKIFEAAYYGIPTVASPTTTFQKVIRQNYNGILASTHDEWAHAITKLATNRTLRHKIGHAAKETIAPLYQPGIAASRQAALYSYLASGNIICTQAKLQEKVYQSVLKNPFLSTKIIAHCGLFNSKEYTGLYPETSKFGAERHYLEYGYKENRKWSQQFDGWWYDISNGLYNSEKYNPIVHAVFYSKAASALLQSPKFPDTQQDNLPDQPLRACLFAAFDKDNVIDPSVVRYVKELSKYADVYFMSDSILPHEELEKVIPYVKGAWAERHGEYDFGSYSRLLINKVGWENVEKYDEVIFANDSCYLIDTLGHVIGSMANSSASWWGLQCSKGMAFSKNSPSNKATANKVITQELLDSFEDLPYYDFHVGSYFFAVRKCVLRDLGFRKIMSSITNNTSKKRLIQNFEVGITRYLIGMGYSFETYIKELYSFHPIFTENHFKFIKDFKFPLLKRYLFTNNHYKVIDLNRHLKEVLAGLPEAACEEIKQSLIRVCGKEPLERNLTVDLFEKYSLYNLEELSPSEFAKVDKKTIKDPFLWIFPACAYDKNLSGNERAVLEHVRNDARIIKVVLTRGKDVDVEGENIFKFDIFSKEAANILLHAGNIFIKHEARINIPYPCDTKSRNFINLWHGIPLKRIGISSLDTTPERRERLIAANARNRCVIASSDIDRMAMANGFYPLTYNDVYITGLPRHDFILKAEEDLPQDMRAELNRLRLVIGNKKLVLFAPTFRNSQEESIYKFSSEELTTLKETLDANNAVLGLREHMADTSGSFSSQLQEYCVDLSSAEYPNIEMLYRMAHCLITDYSSCFIDFLITNKPMISFAYDFESYSSSERGFYYDLNSVFPGPICRSAEVMMLELGKILDNESIMDPKKYVEAKNTFFKYADTKNSERVIKLVSELSQ